MLTDEVMLGLTFRRFNLWIEIHDSSYSSLHGGSVDALVLFIM